MNQTRLNQHRRIPFNLGIADLHSLLDNSLMVHHIAVPLETCCINDDAKAVQRRMDENNFDVLGATANGNIQGYFRRQDLMEGKCQGSRKLFTPADIIASTTPLVELLPLLRVKPYLFVLARTKITSLVTRADLQKSPVRMLLFGLASLLEMYLLEMVRICYPRGSFQDSLSPGRLEKAKRLFSDRAETNEEIDLADCLKMADKYGLLAQVTKFREVFGLGDVKQANKRFKEMERLRDRLAHGQDLAAGSRWEDVLAVADDLEAFLKVCDDKRDKFAQTIGKDKA